MHVAGLVLCGGQSKRMGRPKAWLPFGSEPLLSRIVRLVSQAVTPVVVVAAPGQDLPPLRESVGIVTDEEQYRGPLQGLAGGMAALQGRADAVFVASCDAPFLRPAFIRRMIELLGEARICVPRIGDKYHPLAAVYKLDVLETVQELLRQELRKPRLLFDKLPTRYVEAYELTDIDPQLESLWNLNTPEEYQAAIKALGPAQSADWEEGSES